MTIRLAASDNATAIRVGYTLVETAWGAVGLVCRGRRVCGLLPPGPRPQTLRRMILHDWPGAAFAAGVLPAVQEALREYLAGRRVSFACAIDTSWASPFVRAVLRACCTVDLGQCATYGRLARQIHRPRAARAVGAALAANRTPILIPCHRIIAADGRLGGYSAHGGAPLKARLLAHERQIVLAAESPSVRTPGCDNPAAKQT